MFEAGGRHWIALAGVLAIGIATAQTAAAQSIAPSLVPHRIQGAAPLAVFFDATGTTCSTCSMPFHELDYAWDFGDGASGTWSTTGKSKNLAYGPTTAHVFESPGVYTVQLDVTGHQGGSNSANVDITVIDPDTQWSGSETVCFSSSGSFEGCPSGAKQQITSSFSTAMSSCGTSDRRCLFRRGETFTSGGITLGANGPSMIGPFGSGSQRPRLSFSGGVSIGMRNDWRVVGVEMEGPGGGVPFQMTGRGVDILVLNTVVIPGTYHSGFSAGGNALDLQGLDVHENLFLVGNDWRDFGFGSGGNIVFVSARRLAFLGNVMWDSTGGEHIIRVQHGEGVVVSNNKLGFQADAKGVLSLRSRDQNGSCSAGCGHPTNHVVVSDNLLHSRDDNTVYLTGRDRSTQTPLGEDFLIERNFIAKPSGSNNGNQLGINVNDSRRVTIRNNILVMDGWQAYRGIEINGGTGLSGYFVSNNSCYSPDNPGQQIRCVRVRSGAESSTVAYNNLAWFPNASSAIVVAGEPNLQDAASNLLAGSNPYVSSSPATASDFKLATGSAAIDAGSSLAHVLLDYDTAQRPAGAAIDIGAFEAGAVVADGSSSSSSPAPGSPPAAPLLLP